jgi:hypothetical protein
MFRIVTNMRTLQNAHNASELPNRHGHDTGSAAQARRFFSQSTRQLAHRYLDVSWARATLNVVGAIALIAVSRIPAMGALGPFMLITGIVWGFMALRVLTLKSAGLLGTPR